MRPEREPQQAGFVPTRPRADHPVEIDTIPVLARPILASRIRPGNVVHHGDRRAGTRNHGRATTYTGSGPRSPVDPRGAESMAGGAPAPWRSARRRSTGRSVRPGPAVETGGGATGARSPLLVTGSAAGRHGHGVWTRRHRRGVIGTVPPAGSAISRRHRRHRRRRRRRRRRSPWPQRTSPTACCRPRRHRRR